MYWVVSSTKNRPFRCLLLEYSKLIVDVGRLDYERVKTKFRLLSPFIVAFSEMINVLDYGAWSSESENRINRK